MIQLGIALGRANIAVSQHALYDFHRLPLPHQLRAPRMPKLVDRVTGVCGVASTWSASPACTQCCVHW
jgi:hypothetical protein